MNPIKMWCSCGWGKHYTWISFLRCVKHSNEEREAK